MFKSLLAKLRHQYWGYRTEVSALSSIAKVAELRALKDELRRHQPDNIALSGFKVYSQNDEDGIIERIFDTIPHQSSFLEIGVENGRECNSHYLALKGWRGAWVEADEAQNAIISTELGAKEFPGQFRLFGMYATPSNIRNIYQSTCELAKVTDIDFFSLDIDGQDLYVLEALLSSGARPSVLCLEYNSKFPPRLAISVSRSDNWDRQHDDYYGASLSALNAVASDHSYVLVACNVVGVNAFFIRSDFSALFSIYSAESLYQPFRMNLASYPLGFEPSLKFLRDVLNDRTTTSERSNLPQSDDYHSLGRNSVSPSFRRVR